MNALPNGVGELVEAVGGWHEELGGGLAVEGAVAAEQVEITAVPRDRGVEREEGPLPGQVADLSANQKTRTVSKWNFFRPFLGSMLNWRFNSLSFLYLISRILTCSAVRMNGRCCC